jgi:hypothetical protein
MTTFLRCNCLGWLYRQTCKHTLLIAKLAETGATFVFPFEMQSSRDPRVKYLVDRVKLA